MKNSIFGTDGIRGLVNTAPINPDIILKLGISIGKYLEAKGVIKRVVIAKDTRLSGYMMEPALTSGLISMGVDVILVGPMPTPSIPILIKSLRADFGIMITASHNPYHDNGVKLFNKYGYKLNEYEKEVIEKYIFDKSIFNNLAEPSKLGVAKRLEDAPGRYIEYVKRSFPKHLNLSGIKVVIDCANGSAYKLAPIILWELGAEVVTLGCSPNGFNINENCGSMHPKLLCEEVRKTGADIGIALDGDADRILVCDENGEIINGDILIGLIATHLKNISKLKGDTVVVTKVSNTALEQYFKNIGISTVYTDVGDIKVSERLNSLKLNFGGEESGHIIFSDYSHAGDGIISALQILAILVDSKKRMSELTNIFKLNPSFKNNIRFKGDDPLEKIGIIDVIDDIKKQNPDLKIIVRRSGTEDIIRVLVEGNANANKVLCQLVEIISG
ncbi:MAG: phosphoglucosamine mutase [Candidatus Midichloriaceae bacterium]|jgi:phosphoglucosamine mutase